MFAPPTVVDHLDYLDRVRELLRDIPRPAGQDGALSEIELAAMRDACAAGKTPLSFVSRILFERRVAAQQERAA